MTELIYQAFSTLINLLYILIIVRCFISWFPVNRNNPVISFIYSFTEPILAPLRNMINKSPLSRTGLVLDFSPILALLVLRFLTIFVAAAFGYMSN